MPVRTGARGVAGYDIVIVGGGVNGCGIARDAAGRGCSVLLAETSDLGGATSSASTKLIHGGLRYLEHLEFGLVRKALIEREILLGVAPHIIHPLRFVLPHHRGLRPAWLLRLGLFLYDHLGGRRLLPPTRGVNLHDDPAGTPLRDSYTRGFEYSDCWVDDSRLVALNAIDAMERGADIRVGTRVTAAERNGAQWRVQLEDAATGCTDTVGARVLVNATGPWADSFQRQALGLDTASPLRLVRGSHIVVPRIPGHDHAYIFQNTDRRVVFAIPYERDFTLIGTTDEDHDGDPDDAHISDTEIEYLCRTVSDYFRVPVTGGDVVWTYSGVRPLHDDGTTDASAATRDYVLTLDGDRNRAALLNVIGGKLTTFRRLAEAVIEHVTPWLGDVGAPWTARTPLPGGDFAVDGFDDLVADLCRCYPFLAREHMHRLARAYGTRARALLGDARTRADLGRVFGADLTEREVVWLMNHEWARCGADIVWRRSKLGLRMDAREITALDAFMAARAMPASVAASG